MPAVFSELVVDANDVPALAEFWRRVLDWDATEHGDDVELSPPDGSLPTILFQPVEETKAVKNRLHLDVSPALGSDQPAELERLLALGAKRIDIGQGEQTWHVLADPEGNEFCLLRTPK
ncbi:VOC family protein [Embleya sp. NBC_00896]|uniref:VOC family protein n=1 Tax=Embleya sp. NBC_00896 TaxID=2975961 RepID=UPI00386C794A|nr:VOC family protein [Embleya sp. NBC_00896]